MADTPKKKFDLAGGASPAPDPKRNEGPGGFRAEDCPAPVPDAPPAEKPAKKADAT